MGGTEIGEDTVDKGGEVEYGRGGWGGKEAEDEAGNNNATPDSINECSEKSNWKYESLRVGKISKVERKT